jgi:hypothetical protein
MIPRDRSWQAFTVRPKPRPSVADSVGSDDHMHSWYRALRKVTRHGTPGKYYDEPQLGFCTFVRGYPSRRGAAVVALGYPLFLFEP